MIPFTSVMHPPKVVVWGIFSHQAGSKLNFVLEKKAVTAEYYHESILAKEGFETISRKSTRGQLIEKKMLSSMSKAIFMKDSAPPHCSKRNYEWLNEIFPQYWREGIGPGNSPDLNLTENLWSIMKQELAELPPVTTIQALKKQHEMTWSNFNTNLLKKLVESMPIRFQKVTETRGKYTD